MMTYEQTTQYLFAQVPSFQQVGASAYKEGLEGTLALDSHFGHPHRRFKTIHVAGTNGKGSCSHSIASVLQETGLKVGLYTSPHLRDFRERIRVNGTPVSEAFVCRFVEEHRAFFEPLHPSFFELTTAMAFTWFAEQQVDIAVIEVGLGGRLDCTNIISPLLSVITNISLDHTQFLGHTLAAIAGEKAGIIKTNTPVVIGETLPETLPVFEAKACEMHAPLFIADNEKHREVTAAAPRPEGGMTYETRSYGKLEGELGGVYQQKNTNTILLALHTLSEVTGMEITEEHIRRGLARVSENTGLEGRWQIIARHPFVVCDTGHNAAGWHYLSQQIKLTAAAHRHTHIVFGMVDDKDIDTVMQMLPPTATYHFTQASTHRAIPVAAVAEKAHHHGLQGTCTPTVAEAYREAMAMAEADDFVFVGGSSYVVADFLVHLGKNT